MPAPKNPNVAGAAAARRRIGDLTAANQGVAYLEADRFTTEELLREAAAAEELADGPLGGSGTGPYRGRRLADSLASRGCRDSRWM